MSGNYVVAIDVGGTSIKAELQVAEGQAFWSTRVPTPKGDPAAAVRAVLSVVDQATQAGWERQGVGPVAIGIASLGLVDSVAGVARRSVATGWVDVPLRDLVTERTGLPTVLGHDIRAAALAEHALAQVSPLLFVAVGTGVGGALVTDHGLYLGAHELAVEIGHIEIGGPDACPCGGTGCVETIASAAATERRYFALTGRTASTRDIAADPDPAAVEIWRSAARALAWGLATAVTLLDPAVIVVGGGVAEAGPEYLDLISSFLRAEYHLSPPPALRPAKLGERAAVVGAGRLAWSADRTVAASR